MRVFAISRSCDAGGALVLRSGLLVQEFGAFVFAFYVAALVLLTTWLQFLSVPLALCGCKLWQLLAVCRLRLPQLPEGFAFWVATALVPPFLLAVHLDAPRALMQAAKRQGQADEVSVLQCIE